MISSNLKERYGYQIADLRHQLCKTKSDLETSKKVAAQAIHENNILKHNLEALHIKVMQGDELKKRHEANLDLFSQVHAKKQHLEEFTRIVYRMCKERNAENSRLRKELALVKQEKKKLQIAMKSHRNTDNDSRLSTPAEETNLCFLATAKRRKRKAGKDLQSI